MAETRKPWEGLGNVTVADAPSPAPTQEQPAPPTQQPAQTPGRKPWEGLGNVTVTDAPPAAKVDQVAAATVQGFLEQEKRPYKAPTLSWIEQAGRAAFPEFVDKRIAKGVYENLKDKQPGLTLEQTQRMVKGVLEHDQSTSATVAGVLGMSVGVGGVVAKTGGRLIADAAVRSGTVKGALTFAARHPKMAWLGRSAAIGGAAGATEEAIRTSIEQTALLATGTDKFNKETVLDAAITGGVVGAIGAPALSGAQSAAQGTLRWLGASFGLQGPQLMQAAGRLRKAISHGDESLDDAITRLAADKTEYMAKNGGRQPALVELVTPEQADDVADVIRHITGLDTVARGYADDIVERAAKNLEDTARSGATLKSPMELQEQGNRLYDALGKKYGGTPVAVTDEALDALTRNSGWLASQTNPSSRAIRRVIDAKENIASLRTKVRDARNRVRVTGGAEEVADLRAQLAEMIDSYRRSAAVPGSEIAELRNVIRLESALNRHLAAQTSAGKAAYKTDALEALLRDAENVLEDFNANGLKIPYRDANSLRSRAGEHARGAYRAGDMGKGDVLRELNEALMTVGEKEVPQGNVVRKLYRDAMTRGEAQAAGMKAVKAEITPENLGAWVRGLTPEGSRIGKERMPAHTQGAAEGVDVAMLDVSRGTPREMMTAVENITTSKKARANIAIASPKKAPATFDAAKQAYKSLSGAESLRRPKSRASSAEERAEIQNMLMGGFLSSAGGAAKAGFFTRALMWVGLPRGTARKTVDMLADPAKMDQALAFMQSKKIDLRAFFGAFSGGSAGRDQ